MDLWIRSQDKRILGIARDIHICERRVVVEYPELHSEKDPDNYVILIGGYEYGVYKTKERVLEVLDEIQKLLVPCYIVDKDYNSSLDMFIQNKDSEIKVLPRECVVYEMPADEEVEK